MCCMQNTLRLMCSDICDEAMIGGVKGGGGEQEGAVCLAAVSILKSSGVARL